jgi:hypothetical protein
VGNVLLLNRLLNVGKGAEDLFSVAAAARLQLPDRDQARRDPGDNDQRDLDSVGHRRDLLIVDAHHVERAALAEGLGEESHQAAKEPPCRAPKHAGQSHEGAKHPRKLADTAR